MLWLMRLILWPFCAEWLLFTRGDWLAPGVAFMLTAMLAARTFLVIDRLPMFEFAVFFAFLMILLGTFRYTLMGFTKQRRRRREHYGAPVAGFDGFTEKLGKRPRRSGPLEIGMEPLFALIFSLAIILCPATFMPYAVMYNRDMVPFGWRTWVIAHEWGVAAIIVLLPVLALLVHNIIDWKATRYAPPAEDLGDFPRGSRGELFPEVGMSGPGFSSPDVNDMRRRF